MLFSDDRIANFVNESFEATWQNVREVPIVTIDFGDGNVLTRTLNGNIATHVCDANGRLLDVLPGIYEPVTYHQKLEQLSRLHQWVLQRDDGHRVLLDYHRRQAAALARGEAPLEIHNRAYRSKKVIEGAVNWALLPGRKAADRPEPAASFPAGGPATREELAGWSLLAEDTRINERFRRRQIHEHLLAEMQQTESKGGVTPSAITKWIYREVLDADLDDPYLGLGKTLFASYPFEDG